MTRLKGFEKSTLQKPLAEKEKAGHTRELIGLSGRGWSILPRDALGVLKERGMLRENSIAPKSAWRGKLETEQKAEPGGRIISAEAHKIGLPCYPRELLKGLTWGGRPLLYPRGNRRRGDTWEVSPFIEWHCDSQVQAEASSWGLWGALLHLKCRRKNS